MNNEHVTWRLPRGVFENNQQKTMKKTDNYDIPERCSCFDFPHYQYFFNPHMFMYFRKIIWHISVWHVSGVPRWSCPNQVDLLGLSCHDLDHQWTKVNHEIFLVNHEIFLVQCSFPKKKDRWWVKMSSVKCWCFSYQNIAIDPGSRYSPLFGSRNSVFASGDLRHLFMSEAFSVYVYPLVNCYIAMENHHAINWKIHYFNGHFPLLC